MFNKEIQQFLNCKASYISSLVIVKLHYSILWFKVQSFITLWWLFQFLKFGRATNT